jgi:nitrate reductase gamma subunit
MAHDDRGGLRLIRKLGLALLLGASASWLNLGLSLAHTGEVHVGGLSSTASWAIIVGGVALAALFLGLFVLSWRRSVQSSVSPSGEDGVDVAPEPDSRDGA